MIDAKTRLLLASSLHGAHSDLSLLLHDANTDFSFVFDHLEFELLLQT